MKERTTTCSWGLLTLLWVGARSSDRSLENMEHIEHKRNKLQHGDVTEKFVCKLFCSLTQKVERLPEEENKHLGCVCVEVTPTPSSARHRQECLDLCAACVELCSTWAFLC